MEQDNRTQTYVCRRARMCSYLMESGFQPYRITSDRNDPSREVFLFSASKELYDVIMNYIKQRPAEDGKVSVRLLREDWTKILDALSLAEDDMVEQADMTMSHEDVQSCMDAAATYANIFTEIQKQIGEKE